MKNRLLTFMILCMVLFTFTACGKNTASQKKSASATEQNETVAPQPQTYTGTVTETMSTAGYTYVQVDTGKEKIWAAAPEFKIQKGVTVIVPPGTPMTNFQSKTLDRTFDRVWFVPHFQTAQGEPIPPVSASKTPVTCAVPANAPDFSSIKKAENGYTVAELYAQKENLANKEVIVRGKVVKYNANIMKTNWIHIQDGTGNQGTNDLTVTTDNTAKIGDTLLIKGILILDKDFGYGYKYDLIIENAR